MDLALSDAGAGGRSAVPIREGPICFGTNGSGWPLESPTRPDPQRAKRGQVWTNHGEFARASSKLVDNP